MPYDELDKPIQEKDKEFADLIVRVLESCKKWKTIKPTRTNLIGEGYKPTALAHMWMEDCQPLEGVYTSYLHTKLPTRKKA